MVEAKFRVQCPECNGFYTCSLHGDPGLRKADGSYMFTLRLPQCHHVVLVHLDANMNPRSVEALHDPHIDVKFISTNRGKLLLREKELLDLYAAAIDMKDLGKTEKIWQELKRVRQEIMDAGLD